MKFSLPNFIKVIATIFLISTTYTKSLHKNSTTSEFDLVYNQKEVFPNQYQPATNTTNLDSANFSSPQLSSALSETDPQRKLRLTDFTKIVNFVAYRMTRGETEQMFLFADGNRDGLLASSEWSQFIALFILPFEACDRNHDYLLDEAEFAFCFNKDPKFRSVIFPRKYSRHPHKEIMSIMTTRQAELLNFSEYLFTRRALYAWKACQSNAKYIAKSHFACALKTALSFERKVNYKPTDEEIYMAGIALDSDSAVQLNFLSYLRVLHYFNLFNIYSAGNPGAELQKQQLLKAIREDRLPNNLEESEVNYWYELISANPFKKADSMGFPTFVFFYSLHELFNKYSVARPNQLNEEEFLKLLDDELAPSNTTFCVDKSFTDFTESEYQEASLALQRRRPHETPYFVSFVEKIAKVASLEKEISEESNSNLKNKEGSAESESEELSNSLNSYLREKLAESLTKFGSKARSSQDASVNTAAIWHPKTVNATFYSTEANERSRHIFFTIFKQGTADYLTKSSYYLAFALGNLFSFLVPDERFVVPSTEFVDKLMTAYEITNPPINSEQRKNYHIYKVLSRDISIDILTFFAIEYYTHKLKATMRSSNIRVPETIVKLMLNDFGMRHMPDTVIDLGKVGDTISKRRLYDPEKTMVNSIFVQSIASDNARMTDFRRKASLKTNRDPSRRFPGYPRRAQASPFV